MEQTALTTYTPRVEFDDDKIDLIKNTIAKGASDIELALFLEQCKRTGLDPIARQIYSVRRKQWNSQKRSYEEAQVIQVSIDGYRLIADRSNRYAGQDGPYWCDQSGEWREVWLESTPPAAAKVGVLRHDFIKPVYAIALFSAYVQTNSNGEAVSRWKTDPAGMLAKCAEALALRKAFPNDLSGLYTTEEMMQADNQLPAGARTLQLDAPHTDAVFFDEPTAVITAGNGNHNGSKDTAPATQEGQEGAQPPAKVTEEPEKKNGAKNGAQTANKANAYTLSLDEAKNEKTSDGEPYGLLTLDELQNRRIGIKKALAGKSLTAEKRPLYERKRAALEMLIPIKAQERQQEIAQAAREVGLADAKKTEAEILGELGYTPEPEQPPMIDMPPADPYADLRAKAKEDPTGAYWGMTQRLGWTEAQATGLIETNHNDITLACRAIFLHADTQAKTKKRS